MRTSLLVLASVLCGVAGCAAGRAGGIPGRDRPDGGLPGEPDPTWTLAIDTSASDRYLTVDDGRARIAGTLTASDGADRAEVDGDAVTMDTRGAFSTEVEVPQGLSHIEVIGYDTEDRSIHGDRALLRANYREEGLLNQGAIAIAVSDALLAGLSETALGALGGLDLAMFLPPGTPLVSDGRCTIVADSITHGAPTLSLARTEDGRLRATATVGDIAVNFHGSCSLLGNSITIREGSQADQTEVQLSMTLAPIEVPGECSRGLTATDISTNITRFDLDLRLGGCGLLCLAGELVGEIAEGTVRGMLEDRVGMMIDGAIAPALADVSILDTTTSMNFLDTPVDVGLCLVGLGPENGELVARLGARAEGPRTYGADAPGAPSLPVTRTTTAPGTLAIDPGLIGQILFSAWRGGALELDSLGSGSGPGGFSLTVDLLAGPVPALRDLIGEEFPRGSPLTLGIEAAMAPLARAATPMEAAMGVDFFLELGDLRIRIGVGTRELFVISSTVRLALSLEPNAEGALVPTLVEAATSTTTFLQSTTVPGVTGRMGDALAGLVDGLIAGQIAPLLEGAAISLPDVGTPLVVSDVSVGTGGYMVLTLLP